jgi:hypothetical protein
VKWTLDNFTKLLGLLSFCLIAAATIHDWAYFRIVGSKFRSIQTTYDYITYTIEWIPLIFFILAVSWLAAVFLAPRTTLFDEEGLSGQGIRRLRRHRFVFAFFFSCCAVPLFIYSLVKPHPFNLYLIGLAILPIISGAYLFVYHSQSANFFPFFAVLMSATIYTYGLLEGATDSVGNISDVHSLQLKGAPERQVMLLRSFEKGVLIRSPSDNRIEFIKWDQIEKLSHRVGLALQPSGCTWLKSFCDEVVIP